MNRIQVHIASKGYRLAAMAMGLGISLAQGQFTWQTTHTTSNGFNQGLGTVIRNAANVTVFPNYLDVEEEIEVATQGTVSVGNDAATLEIAANFTLSPEAAIVGGLLWNGNTILGAKLLSRSKADSLYESQVDRNSAPPPRPRDPLLLEEMGNGAYRVRIYPVALGSTRRFRIRYHIPPGITKDGVSLPLRTMLGSLAPQITLNLKGGGGVTKATVIQAAGTRSIEFPRSLILPSSGYLLDVPAEPPGQGVATFFLQPGEAVGQAASLTHFSSGAMAGHYLNLWAKVPEIAVNKASSLADRAGSGKSPFPVITATVRNSKHAYDSPLTCIGGPTPCSPFVFHGKSDAAWDSTVVWTVYDFEGKVAASYKQTPKLFQRDQDTAMAILWAASSAPFSEGRENPLGPVYGFVDGWASLLALEKDALDPASQIALAAGGVPRIANQNFQDVLPNYNTQAPKPNVPIQVTGIHEHNSPLSFSSAVLTWTKTSGTHISLRFNAGGTVERTVTVRILSLNGKTQILRVLSVDASGTLSLSCASLKAGNYLLSVKIGDRVLTAPLNWNGE